MAWISADVREAQARTAEVIVTRFDQAHNEADLHRRPDDWMWRRALSEASSETQDLVVTKWQTRFSTKGDRQLGKKAAFRFKRMCSKADLALEAVAVVEECLEVESAALGPGGPVTRTFLDDKDTYTSIAKRCLVPVWLRN